MAIRLDDTWRRGPRPEPGAMRLPAGFRASPLPRWSSPGSRSLHSGLVLAPWPPAFEDVFGQKRLFINALFNGITLGGLYFLVATGFTLIFGLMRNVNLAHGSLYLFGGYMGYEARRWTGLVAVELLSLRSSVARLSASPCRS